MGLVSWNNTKLSIEQVPDGHAIVSEQELSQLRLAANSYGVLKSYIPIGVRESDLGNLLEKGSKYDTLTQEKSTLSTKVDQLTSEVGKFSNIPKEFSSEKWNNYVQKEQSEIRAGKISAIEKQAHAFIEKEFGIKMPVIRPEYMPDLKDFDTEHKDAVKNYVDVLDKAHTAQKDAFKQMLELQNNKMDTHVVGAIDSSRPATDNGVRPADTVSNSAMALQKL